MRTPGERSYVRPEKRQMVARCALALAVFLTAVIPAKLAAAQDGANPEAKFTLLYGFTGGTDGLAPYAGLVSDAVGNLYGTTELGGDLSCHTIPPHMGCGMVFKIDTARHETVLHAFENSPDGAFPLGDLLLASDGALYGTAAGGGSMHCTDGCGIVFKIDTTTGTYSIVYKFLGGQPKYHGKDGSSPLGGLVQDEAGNLYGTTEQGGGPGTRCSQTGCGTVFKVDKAGKETVLHRFNNNGDVGDPTGDIVLDALGNLYGTGWSGGSAGVGGVWKTTKSGKETVLHVFEGGNDGAYPEGGITQDQGGTLYGTTQQGGAYNSGTVFKVSKAGVEKVLYAFGARNYDGVEPDAAPVPDNAGNLYGTTATGYYNDVGTVYKIDIKTGKEKILYGFTGGSDCGAPQARLVVDSSGNLYGTTSGDSGTVCPGTVFKISGAQ